MQRKGSTARANFSKAEGAVFLPTAQRKLPLEPFYPRPKTPNECPVRTNISQKAISAAIGNGQSVVIREIRCHAGGRWGK